MVVDDRRLAGGDQGVVGDDLVAVEDLDPPVMTRSPPRLADQADRDRVAGRADPHAGQPVDLAHA